MTWLMRRGTARPASAQEPASLGQREIVLTPDDRQLARGRREEVPIDAPTALETFGAVVMPYSLPTQ